MNTDLPPSGVPPDPNRRGNEPASLVESEIGVNQWITSYDSVVEPIIEADFLERRGLWDAVLSVADRVTTLLEELPSDEELVETFMEGSERNSKGSLAEAKEAAQCMTLHSQLLELQRRLRELFREHPNLRHRSSPSLHEPAPRSIDLLLALPHEEELEEWKSLYMIFPEERALGDILSIASRCHLFHRETQAIIKEMIRVRQGMGDVLDIQEYGDA